MCLAIFGLDDENVQFGNVGGEIAVLSPDGNIICALQAHSSSILGTAQNIERHLLVCVSTGSTLSVQNLDRLDSPRTGIRRVLQAPRNGY